MEYMIAKYKTKMKPKSHYFKPKNYRNLEVFNQFQHRIFLNLISSLEIPQTYL